ncbi:MAG: hypothetical protein JOZ13_08030 [Alphaproteobacteria bacterium]|nr:hypothetical protein [Alphaproteobacteria bacterium]
MLKKTLLSALLLGAAVTAQPSQAWVHPGHPGFHPHAGFVFRHDFHHFTPVEHRLWVGGHWRHMWWHGRFGWWWGVDGAWYWYPAPIYPYPEVVSSYYYDEDGDYDDDGAGPGDQNGGYDQGGYDQGGGYGTWYHCANPEGYYPYIKSCRGGWEQVPAQPNDMQGPDGGPRGRDDQGPDNGPNGAPYDENNRPPPPPR